MISNLGLSIVAVLTSITTFIWYSVYTSIVRKYKPGDEYASRVVAALHAITAIILAGICIYEGPDPLTKPGSPNTVLQVIAMANSLGYFIYDLWWCLSHQSEPLIIICHHVASIMAIAIVMIHGRSGGEAIGGLGTLECTNPLLQARWFLRTHGYQNTPLHRVTELSFIILFILMRLGYGSRLTYVVVMSSNVILLLKISTVLLYVISLIFIYYIFDFIIRKYVLKGVGTCTYMCSSDCEHKEKDKEF